MYGINWRRRKAFRRPVLQVHASQCHLRKDLSSPAAPPTTVAAQQGWVFNHRGAKAMIKGLGKVIAGYPAGPKIVTAKYNCCSMYSMSYNCCSFIRFLMDR
jgi:hypothetical protein